MLRLMRRRFEGYFTFLVFVAATLISASQALAKPNFSGEWKLNVSKSEFGPIPAPDKRTDKITHQDPKLKSTISSSGQGGDITYDMNYSTDGGETSNDIRGNTMKSVAKWEGDTLVIQSKVKFGDNDIEFRDKWTLSEDGKTLTVNRHIKAAQGEVDTKVVFEKQ